tara:strand:+ start:778 stop:1983 length:1206 start_codon:yes stop_codon:yes gene_type:complete
VPTEYGANQYVNEFYNIRATIDGLELPGIISLNFKHKVNSSRIATITFSNRESLEMVSVGAFIKINFGLSDAYGNKTVIFEEGTNLGLPHTPYPNDFYGRIKVIKPSFNTTTITAMDLVSDLATSTSINIQWRDYGTQDMYYVAKDICDHAGIDISLLTESTKYLSNQEGGKLQPDFKIYGVQTRGSFLNKLFDLMTFNPTDNTLLNPDTAPRGAYMSDPLPFIQFFYAIRQDNKMEFFSPNRYDKRKTPVLKVSANETNIVGDGLVGQIDSSTIINSVTVTSSQDSTASITLEDQSSIDKHGVFSKAFSFDSTNKNRMREFAFIIIQNFKMPTNTYKIQLTGAEWVQLGDLVEISSPLLGTKEIYPVIEKDISVTNSVVTKLAVGKRSISTKKLLELVQR